MTLGRSSGGCTQSQGPDRGGMRRLGPIPVRP